MAFSNLSSPKKCFFLFTFHCSLNHTVILNSKDRKNWEASYYLLKVNKQSSERLLMFLPKEIFRTKGLSFKNIMYLEKKKALLLEREGLFNQVEEKCHKRYVRFYYLLVYDHPILFPSQITQHIYFDEFNNSSLLLNLGHKVSKKKKFLFSLF